VRTQALGLPAGRRPAGPFPAPNAHRADRRGMPAQNRPMDPFRSFRPGRMPPRCPGGPPPCP